MSKNILQESYNRRTFTKALLAGAAGCAYAAQSQAAQRPTVFSLGDDQTSIKDQLHRGTCYVYAAVAALEAAYYRAGYGKLDLSEEFCNDAIRSFWLEPRRNVPKAADQCENLYAMGDGGYEYGVVQMMERCGFAIPTEKSMPYRDRRPHTQEEVQNNARWRSQYNMGSFNLNPKQFDSVSLANATFYAARSAEPLLGTDPEGFESMLTEKKREIVWGLFLPKKEKPNTPFWDFIGYPGKFGHAMMIYGFNRSNPKKPYFLVKNSWGDKDTFISYDFVRKYGDTAIAIVDVEKPRAWPELAVIGRWSLEIDGRSGVFDLYHLPGMSATAFEAHNRIDRRTGQIEEDRRLGTFFVNGEPDRAFRVNGSIGTDGLRLNVDWNNAACSYSHRGGQQFTLRFVGGSQEVMKGKLIGGDKVGQSVIAKRLRAKEHFEYVA